MQPVFAEAHEQCCASIVADAGAAHLLHGPQGHPGETYACPRHVGANCELCGGSGYRAVWHCFDADHTTQLTLETRKQMNLSTRYINALRQLAQYNCNVDHTGPLTHVMTGVRVSPIGILHDADDASGILEVEYPGGHKIQVHAFAFFKIALKECAEIEISTAPRELGVPEGKINHVQQRIANLAAHLRGKHGLD